MGEQYEGDDTVFPESFEIPDDGDELDAASVNVGFEALGDRTAYLKNRADISKCVPIRTEFLASGSITIPADALTWGDYEGSGGGGAGAPGGFSPSAGNILSGGGGGGGAIRIHGTCPLVPGETYSVSVGSGGTGVTVFVGNPGADTQLVRNSNAAVIVRCRGAGGGEPGQIVDSIPAVVTGGPYPVGGSSPATNNYVCGRGGAPVRPTTGTIPVACEPTIYASVHLNLTPQAGGLGVCSTWATGTSGGQGFIGVAGQGSPEGFDGGASGTPGTHNVDAPDCFGGGAGGGGGAGAWGAGGAGGTGSHATGAAGAAAAGGNGTSAAANTGAGGGGGGGAGSGSNHSIQGGNPGNGGSGRFYMTYYLPVTG